MKRVKNSAGGVVVGPRGKIAIIHQFKDSYSLPKGRINEGESKLAAAKRKIFEETGIRDLVLVNKLGEYTRSGIKDKDLTLNITIFHFKTSQRSLDPQNKKDIDRAEWVTREEVAGLLTHEKDKEFFRNAVSKI